MCVGLDCEVFSSPDALFDETPRTIFVGQREESKRKLSTMRKQWQGKDCERTGQASSTPFCNKCMQCFEVCEETYLNVKRTELLKQSEGNRRGELLSKLLSNYHFYFNGNHVCNTFPAKVFRLSSDVQVSAGQALQNKLSFQEQFHTPEHVALSAELITGAHGRASIISYLERVADSSSDCMPDVTKIHLPFSKCQVYDCFV